ncbi:MAG TPA: oligosaccharide flippase family protein [Qipengyuania sp.]|nr:oligosaccharide flippase family protein [Qipengyuania sp.]
MVTALFSFVRSVRPKNAALAREVGWVAGPFGVQQALRLGTNIVLTRLLAPEIFGIMLLINSLRTGTELLSDIGIGQSVVRSPNGEDRDFLDVAWTLQVLRGLLLALIILLAAAPIAALYDRPDLAPLILALSPVFVFTGLQSAGLFLAQRWMELKRRAVYEVASTVIHTTFAIGLALFIKSAWALVIALVISTLLTTLLSFLVFERRLPRFRWEAAHVREIFSFGKWIFLSTAIYFAAISFDRFYFVAAVPIAMAGIYGVARTFSDMLVALAQRAGAFLVFPRAAAAQDPCEERAPRLRQTRRKTLALVALAIGAAVAGSDQFILLAYDPRYHAAAFMIPVLIVGVWFGILSTFADSMLMGAGRPAPGAWANLAKFAVMLAGLPVALARGSLLDALLVLVLAEVARWLALLAPSRREGFAGLTDDCVLTILMAATALTLKWLLGAMGLVPTLGEWWAMRELLHV